MKIMHPEADKIIKRWGFNSGQGEVSPPTSIRRTLYALWMKFARALGRANALILLTIVYFILVGPAALVLKILGKDLLDRKAGSGPSYWQDKLQEELTLDRSKHPF